jgi:hypothetical protein|tara:strand:- start:333 stop:560 length:228 start_codon:yes stop_codon:yes gene_type:complete
MDLVGDVPTSKPRKVLERFTDDKSNFSAQIELGDVPSRPYIVCFEEDGYGLTAKGYKTLVEARTVSEKYLQTGNF